MLFIIESHKLFDAIYNNNLDEIDNLVKNNVNTFNALQHAAHCGHLRIVKYFVLNCENNKNNYDSALKWACNYNRIEVIKYLLTLGAYHRAVAICFDNISDLFYEGYFDVVVKLIDNKNYFVEAEAAINLLRIKVNRIINNKIINKLYKIKTYCDVIIKI